MIKAVAVIVAGGKGERMGGGAKKQYLPLAGKPIITRTILNIASCPLIHHIILVVPEVDLQYCRHNIINALPVPVVLVSGGADRQQSVYQGLMAVTCTDSVILIHDGVRPFISQHLITDCIREAAQSGACILATPVTDTIKQSDTSDHITATIDRTSLFLAQTPQCFSYSIILQAHQSALENNLTGTDDASLVERLGVKVKIIAGSPYNIKITTPADLILAQAIQNGYFSSTSQ